MTLDTLQVAYSTNQAQSSCAFSPFNVCIDDLTVTCYHMEKIVFYLGVILWNSFYGVHSEVPLHVFLFAGYGSYLVQTIWWI